MTRDEILWERSIKYALERIYLAEKVYEPKKGDTMLCEICGRKVHLLNDGKGPLICCGQPMVKSTLPVQQEAGFKKYPEGWSKKSVKKFANTLTKEEVNAATRPGFFDKCVKKMKNKMKNPEGFCASIKDVAHGSTYWRGKDKSPKEVKKDTKTHKNV